MVSFSFSWVRQLQNAISALLGAFCRGGASQQKRGALRRDWLSVLSLMGTHTSQAKSKSLVRVDIEHLSRLGPAMELH
jgi:hypothetical protein